MWQDVRFSLRVLARHRGFTATAVAVLALGIGVNAGIFSLINSLLLRPRPGAAEIVGVHSLENGERGGSRAFSYPNYEDVRAGAQPFAHLAAHSLAMAGVTEGDTTHRVLVDIVSANYFDIRRGSLHRTDVHQRRGAARRPGVRRHHQPLRVGPGRFSR